MTSGTRATQRDYVQQVTRLKLWYVWHLHDLPRAGSRQGVSKCVNIRQLTVFGEGKEAGRPEVTQDGPVTHGASPVDERIRSQDRLGMNRRLPLEETHLACSPRDLGSRFE
jgi:hypothetical protein